MLDRIEMSFHHGGVNVQVGNEHELVNETSGPGGRGRRRAERSRAVRLGSGGRRA